MKLKHLKRKIWCKTKYTNIDFIYDAKNREDKQPKKLFKYIRCPDCGKRFLPKVAECYDIGCWHAYLPPHKKIIKVPRKNETTNK